MENKIRASNTVFASPSSGIEKKAIPPPDYGSPKFTRKRQEAQKFFGRMAQKKSEPQAQIITFISPKKYLEHQNGGTDSFKSICSVKSFGRCQLQQNSLQSATININSLANLVQPKIQVAQVPKTFQTAQQIIARVKANKEVQTKAKTENLDKRISELTEKLKNLKQQNTYLYNKIEDFNSIIGEKNSIINQFSILLKEKQQSITFCQNELQYYKRKNQQLQSVIILLNKSVQQCKCSCNNITLQTEDGQKQKESYEEEIEKYKKQILQLNAKIKYSQIQSSMLQKIRYDLDIQLNKNQQLKSQNRKLLARVEHLTEKSRSMHNLSNKQTKGAEKKYAILRRQFQKQSRELLEVSLQLSPQK